MIQLTDEQKLYLSAIAVFIVLVLFCLIVGTIIDSCNSRTIKRHESNVQTAADTVSNSETKVEETKRDASEVNGELKIRKENREEANVEVNEKTRKRIEAAANRERIRHDRLTNVNGSDLNRILNEADRNDFPGRR